MTFAEASEHARNAADQATTASQISAGLFTFSDNVPRKESEYPRLAFETLCLAVNELGLAVEELAAAQSTR